MTDHFDPLDELVSAHLDGETTEEEQARIATDESLASRVASLRLVSEQLADDLPQPDPAVRQSHLDAALGAFDQLDLGSAHGIGDEFDSAGVTEHDGAVVDLGQRRHGARPSGGQRRAGLPPWLGAAAAVVVTVGALGWVMTSVGGGNDSADTAALAPDAPAGEAVETDGASIEAEESVMADEAGSTAVEPAVGGDLAASEESVRANDDAASGDSDTVESDDDAADEEETAEADSGVEPVPFSSIPTDEELAVAAERSMSAPTESLCGDKIEPPAGTSLVGVVPLVVAGIRGEALVFEESDGTRSFVTTTEVCTPFE